jgi:hypothetical protein
MFGYWFFELVGVVLPLVPKFAGEFLLIEVVLLVIVLRPALVVLEYGGVHLIQFFLFLLSILQSAQDLFDGVLLLHPLFGTDEVFLYAALVVEFLDGLVSHVRSTGLYLVDFLLAQDGLELVLDALDILLQLLDLPLEDGYVFVVESVVVVLHEGFQLVLLLPLYCDGT